MNCSLDILRSKMMNCTSCNLHQNRKSIVFGEGPINPQIMLVGESPGEEEDTSGIPFVGKAGEKLNKIISFLGIERKDIYISNAVLCLYPHTLVYLPDGSSKRISQLAAEEYRGPVLSYDEITKSFVSKNVTKIHRNKLGNRKWLKVSYNGAKKNAKGVAGAIVTEDHEFLTDFGWMSAKDIMTFQNNKDCECCEININIGPEGLNTIAYDIAIGTLLGDATIGKTASLEFSHAEDQKEWAILKGQIFGTKPKHKKKTKNNVQDQWRVTTPASRIFSFFREEFYKDGTKQIPKWIAYGITPLVLATWFCDDGHTRIRNKHGGPLAEIATCSFNDESVRILLSGLEKLGVKGFTKKTGKNKQHNRIKFNVIETEKLLKIIAPYVPDCLSYKVPNQDTQGNLISKTFIEQPKNALYCEAIVEEAPDWTYKNKTTYCLSVEDTENFITPGGVVHNCKPPGNRKPTYQELDACRWRLEEQIELVNPKIIIALGKTALEQIFGRPIKGNLSQFFGDWLDYKGIKVLSTYHPSYLLRNPTQGYKITLPHWQKVKAWLHNESTGGTKILRNNQ